MPKSYRVEEWRLEDTLGKMLDILAGYRELEVAKNLTQSIIELYSLLINHHSPPVEVQIRLIELQKMLVNQYLEEGEMKVRDRLRSALGLSSDPVKEASQKAQKQVKATLNQFGREDEKVSQEVLMSSQKLLNSVLKKLNELLDRPELQGKDKKALKEIRKALGNYANRR